MENKKGWGEATRAIFAHLLLIGAATFIGFVYQLYGPIGIFADCASEILVWVGFAVVAYIQFEVLRRRRPNWTVFRLIRRYITRSEEDGKYSTTVWVFSAVLILVCMIRLGWLELWIVCFSLLFLTVNDPVAKVGMLPVLKERCRYGKKSWLAALFAALVGAIVALVLVRLEPRLVAAHHLHLIFVVLPAGSFIASAVELLDSRRLDNFTIPVASAIGMQVLLALLETTFPP